jgi:hypothetical protein
MASHSPRSSTLEIGGHVEEQERADSGMRFVEAKAAKHVFCAGDVHPESIFRPEEFESLALLIKGHDAQTAEMIRNGGVEDLEAYEASRKRAVFVDAWKERLYDVLNEVALSYLERFVFPLAGQSEPETVAEALFPGHADTSKRRNLDSYMHAYFVQPHAKPIPNFDVDALVKRVEKFLQFLSRSEPGAFESAVIRGLCHAMAYMFSEVVELSENSAIQSYRSGIVLYDVRTSIITERDICAKLL